MYCADGSPWAANIRNRATGGSVSSTDSRETPLPCSDSGDAHARRIAIEAIVHQSPEAVSGSPGVSLRTSDRDWMRHGHVRAFPAACRGCPDITPLGEVVPCSNGSDSRGLPVECRTAASISVVVFLGVASRDAVEPRADGRHHRREHDDRPAGREDQVGADENPCADRYRGRGQEILADSRVEREGQPLGDSGSRVGERAGAGSVPVFRRTPRTGR